ncbi:MAG: hypothetical protein AB7R90_04100 [Reyranellaceae bacterium]
MAHINKVLRSINRDDGQLCVDIFIRPDDTFGFEEYRRDPEDPRGWYAIGHHADEVFASPDSALTEARARIPWLQQVMG